MQEKKENKKDMKAQLREDSKLRREVKKSKKQTQDRSKSFDIEMGAAAPRVKSKIETLQEELDEGGISDANLRLLLTEEAKECGTSKLLRRIGDWNRTGEEKQHVSQRSCLSILQ